MNTLYIYNAFGPIRAIQVGHVYKELANELMSSKDVLYVKVYDNTNTCIFHLTHANQ